MTELEHFFEMDDAKKMFVDKTCFKHGEKSGGKFIGGGLYGVVNVVCLKDEITSADCTHVVKIIDVKADVDMSLSDAQEEDRYSQLASALEVGPRYIRSYRCSAQIDGRRSDFYFIITERYDQDLASFLEDVADTPNPEKRILSLKTCIIELIKKCVKFGVLHGDLWSPESSDSMNEGNIVLKLSTNGTVTDARLIDFDRSVIDVGSATNQKIRQQWCNVWKLLNQNPSFRKYKLTDSYLKELCS